MIETGLDGMFIEGLLPEPPRTGGGYREPEADDEEPHH
jgi:hypothetical protein